MKTLLLTIIGASLANVITWLLYQGFINSYWGKNIREEITRVFNRFCKHLNKNKRG